ncbi:hypothetical protein EDD85DRAFT_869142 [Armillaria nabsnona]|nr:hypothetical protein EDD85DRAFT_869142 [Armillaria nabsnona]
MLTRVGSSSFLSGYLMLIQVMIRLQFGGATGNVSHYILSDMHRSSKPIRTSSLAFELCFSLCNGRTNWDFRLPLPASSQPCSQSSNVYLSPSHGPYYVFITYAVNIHPTGTRVRPISTAVLQLST